MDTTKDFLQTPECLELHYYIEYASLKNKADHNFALNYYITNNEIPGE